MKFYCSLRSRKWILMDGSDRCAAGEASWRILNCKKSGYNLGQITRRKYFKS